MKEKCAVFGIKSKSPGKDVFESIYYGLYSLQHRGQESAGMAVYTPEKQIQVYKNMGLVSEVFKNHKIKGGVGIGHVRYSTTGESKLENAHPLTINYAGGSFAIAHNGNIVNSDELKTLLEGKGGTFTTTSDTEIIAQLIAQEHIKAGGRKEDFIEGIKGAMKYLVGSYSLVILYGDKLIAIRDPHGVRPLVLGKTDTEVAVSSESCALDVLDIDFVRDIKPSEILVVGDGNAIESHFGVKGRVSHCMFEYVYFARPDSVIDGKSLYEVRKNLGAVLSKEGAVEADVVVAVPDSGITTAIGYALASGIPYGEGLMKNRYVGRTFILPEQQQRDTIVKVKLNPIVSEIKGKRIVLIDDSIVRGTTQKRLIGILRKAGVREVHVRISCPPLRHPCFYGIDMQTHREFIAASKSVEEIRKTIGADSLVYTSIDGLVEAIGLPKEELCMACLTCDYPIKESQTKLTEIEVHPKEKLIPTKTKKK